MKYKINFPVTDDVRKLAVHSDGAPPELWGTPVIGVMCCGQCVGTFRPPKPADVPLWVLHEVIRPWVTDGNMVGLGNDQRPAEDSRRSQQRKGRPGLMGLPTSSDVERLLTTEKRARGKFVCSSCGEAVPFRLEKLIRLGSRLAEEGRWGIPLSHLRTELGASSFKR